MEEKSIAMSMLEELKRSNKRWFVVSLILLVALVVSNIAWLVYESSFEIEAGYDTDIIQTVEDTDLTNSSINQY